MIKGHRPGFCWSTPSTDLPDVKHQAALKSRHKVRMKLGIIPALRKAQGFYVVVFWFNKIKQAQLLTMLSTALRSTWLKAGDSLRGCVQPAAGDAAVTVATAGRAGL